MITKGYIMSEEHKLKIGLANKGRIHSEESRRHMSEGCKGRIISEEAKQKIREARIKQIITGEQNEKRSKTLMGHKVSEKTRKKISQATRGIKRSEEFKQRMSRRVSGEGHPNWQGGKSYEIYPLGWNRTYKEQIRRRDEYKCQLCRVPEIECSRRLHIHHKDLNKQNIEPDNLESLCLSCHIKLHWKLKKNWWPKE